jgi:riboflavin synthase
MDFGINFIPHTQQATTWGTVAEGDAVNLEIDTMARYVARLRDWTEQTISPAIKTS